MQFGFRLLSKLIEPFLTPRPDDEDVDIDRSVQRVTDYFDELLKDRTRLEEMIKPLIELAAIQDEKNRAVYVDVMKDRVTMPGDAVSEDRCRQYILVVSSEIEQAKKMLSFSVPKELIQDALKFANVALQRKDLEGYLKKHGAGIQLKKIREEFEKMS